MCLLRCPLYFEACAAAANNSSLFSLISCNQVLNRLEINTKVSMFSWGEILTVQLAPAQNGTEISVSSQPKTSIGSQGIGAQETAAVKNKKTSNCS